MQQVESFSNLDDFVRAYRLILPPPRHWWLCDPDRGQIATLPSFCGVAVATNGILVAIKNQTGKIVFGHREWFDLPPEFFKESTKRESKPKAEPEPDISEYY